MPLTHRAGPSQVQLCLLWNSQSSALPTAVLHGLKQWHWNSWCFSSQESLIWLPSSPFLNHLNGWLCLLGASNINQKGTQSCLLSTENRQADLKSHAGNHGAPPLGISWSVNNKNSSESVASSHSLCFHWELLSWTVSHQPTWISPYMLILMCMFCLCICICSILGILWFLNL